MIKITLNLIENAGDSLHEALNHYENVLSGEKRSYKYVVLHFSHSFELVLKYYLTKIHPLLIYKDAFTKEGTIDPAKSSTYGFWETINFISNESALVKPDEASSGYEFGKENIRHLKWMKDLRNRIEHCDFDVELPTLRIIFGKLIRLLDDFNNIHELFSYDGWIKDGVLLARHKTILDELLDEDKNNREEAYRRVSEKEDECFKGVRIKHRAFEDFPIYQCSECGEETFILDNQSDTGFKCELCGATESDYREIECDFCGEVWPNHEMKYEENWTEDGDSRCICPNCLSRFSEGD